MKVKYFQTDNGYLAVTDQSPKDFKGILFIGKIGTDPLNVKEDVFTSEQVLKFREIAKADMPAVWMLAFNYEKPVAPKKPPVEVVEEPLFDPDTFDLIAHIPVKRELVTNLPRQGMGWPQAAGLITGLALWVILRVLGIM